MLDCLGYNLLNTIIYIMGVSGCGKTTIGTLLSKETGYPFFDGDQFHPKLNIEKMAVGIPLSDEDRLPWLNSIKDFAEKKVKERSIIIACSALKQSYRDILANIPSANCAFVLLQGTEEILLGRLQNRVGHFMQANLLASQLEILEMPSNALLIHINQTPTKIVEQIIDKLPITLSMQEFGLIGLGVMGKSLSRNFANKGFTLSLYNRFVQGKEEKVAELFIAEFPELHKTKGFERLNKYGIHFIGAGVSGGEEGALKGPSIMPGGSLEGYQLIQPYLERIAAINEHGVNCCNYIGTGGAGHFVKMVHNGSCKVWCSNSYSYCSFECPFYFFYMARAQTGGFCYVNPYPKAGREY